MLLSKRLHYTRRYLRTELHHAPVAKSAPPMHLKALLVSLPARAQSRVSDSRRVRCRGAADLSPQTLAFAKGCDVINRKTTFISVALQH